jgi:uncharacterized protein YceK
MPRTLILVSLTVCLCGCEAINKETEVYGAYELTSRDGKTVLDVAVDHSFSETIRFSNGLEQKNSGHWQWQDGQVCFDTLLVPKSVMKAYEDGDLDPPKTVGQSYQLDCCVPAGKMYGKTILEINPDSSENFVRSSGATAHSNLRDSPQHTTR